MGIVAKDLGFRYGDRDILKGVSFEGEKGRFICVIGKNGAGKTTLFRTILGGLKGYSGNIFINGKELSAYNEKDLAKQIAYIPQSYSPAYNFSVLDMVLMGVTPTLGFFQQPTKKHRERAVDALSRVGLSEFTDKSFGNISGGEKQMALIARAIAQDAKIIVMDEPCSNLDYGNSIRVMKLCRQLAQSGYLIVQSTHNPQHVFSYADEVMVLQDGKISIKGPPDQHLNEETLRAVYDVDLKLYKLEELNHQVCVPI